MMSNMFSITRGTDNSQLFVKIRTAGMLCSVTEPELQRLGTLQRPHLQGQSEFGLPRVLTISLN